MLGGWISIIFATLAAVLFVVAYNMGEWRQVGAILRLNTAVKMVWVATFALAPLAKSLPAAPAGRLKQSAARWSRPWRRRA
jgi:SulP family sulfate permease